MKVTPNLKAWLVENKLAKTEDDDATMRKAAALAMVAEEKDPGYLSPEKFAELSVDEKVTKASGLEALLNGMVATQAQILESMKAPAVQPAPNLAPLAASEAKSGAPSFFEKSLATSGDGKVAIKVKGAEEWYSTTKTAAVFPQVNKHGDRHVFAGQLVSGGSIDGNNRYLDHPSELDRAVIGAIGKWQLNSANELGKKYFPMTEHDYGLVHYALHHMKWGGVIRNGRIVPDSVAAEDGFGSEVSGTTPLMNRSLTPSEIKALIDDATSGGIEAAPIVFDDNAILTPLLRGELYPKVNTVSITRGRRVEGVAIGNVTMAWGGGDDSDIAVFNTAGFVSAFDTNIFVIDGWIELGKDFISDSPINFESVIMQSYANTLMQQLDNVVAVGNGSTQPEGIMSASGTTSVSFGSTAPTLGGYESLMFGVTKKFRDSPERTVFASNEVSYARARALAVGTTDNRRLFGDGFMGTNGYGNYSVMGYAYAINESMANTQAFFANLARYRMYKRLGLTLSMHEDGKTLGRRNLLAVRARARFGGQLEDGGAAAVSSTLQA